MSIRLSQKNSKARELTQLHDVQRSIFCIFRKISTQPHTSLCKHILIMIHWIKKPHVWMHNEVWGCAEILPNWLSSILPEAMSKTKKNLWKIAQWMWNSEFGLKWKLVLHFMFHYFPIPRRALFLSYNQSKQAISDRVHMGTLKFQRGFVSRPMRVHQMSIG